MVWKKAEVAVPQGKRDSETRKEVKEAVINSRKFFKYPVVPTLAKS